VHSLHDGLVTSNLPALTGISLWGFGAAAPGWLRSGDYLGNQDLGTLKGWNLICIQRSEIKNKLLEKYQKRD
jgi:hypothetical protein